MAGTSRDDADVQENVVVEEPQEQEARNGIDFLKDDPKDMTLGRRIGAQLTSFWSTTYICTSILISLVCFWMVAFHFISSHLIIIALSFMNKGWYNPQSAMEDGIDDDNKDDSRKSATAYPKPSLEKAWAYFEHFALNRYVVEDDSKDMQKAEPGEDDVPTK
jgi:hypothetical protein